MKFSVLIPTYNRSIAHLIATLTPALQQFAGSGYEVLVAEDGSDDAALVADNAMVLSQVPFARHVIYRQNSGRAVVRNRLVCEAKGTWLLFLDSGVEVRSSDFIQRYLLVAGEDVDVVCGGIVATKAESGPNLRYRYECSAAHLQRVDFRRKHPYASFRTTNFCVRRSVMSRFPFDERFSEYGYEDVLFGRTLACHGVRVAHIENNVDYPVRDTNEMFLDKTDAALHTLYEFREELRGYSSLLSVADSLSRKHLLSPVVFLLRPFLPYLRHRMGRGRHAAVWQYNLYRVGTYLCLEKDGQR